MPKRMRFDNIKNQRLREDEKINDYESKQIYSIFLDGKLEGTESLLQREGERLDVRKINSHEEQFMITINY